MKSIIMLLAALALATASITAQKVEDQIWGISVGISPIILYNETTLSDQVTLRSELNVGFGWTSGNAYTGGSEWAFIPAIVVEPRYYYNLEKRFNKGKITHNNSGNYLSLGLGYQPGLAIGTENTYAHPALSFIPKFGVKRSIGKHFSYETNFGLGYAWVFKKLEYPNWNTGAIEEYKETDHGVTFGFQLNIGYIF
jgi:hypothetical protein